MQTAGLAYRLGVGPAEGASTLEAPDEDPDLHRVERGRRLVAALQCVEQFVAHQLVQARHGELVSSEARRLT